MGVGIVKRCPRWRWSSWAIGWLIAAQPPSRRCLSAVLSDPSRSWLGAICAWVCGGTPRTHTRRPRQVQKRVAPGQHGAHDAEVLQPPLGFGVREGLCCVDVLRAAGLDPEARAREQVRGAPARCVLHVGDRAADQDHQEGCDRPCGEERDRARGGAPKLGDREARRRVIGVPRCACAPARAAGAGSSEGRSRGRP